tara:strand:+ start:211 stop:1275 length:1065 start_codon:yes stop_codon:yes gene_type:complete
VHFREPGFEHKATLKSEAASARAGGVHTVCEMPNTSPPTVTIAALADKVRRADEITDCDIRFFFGVTQPPHLITLIDLWTSDTEELKRLKKRCCGVKLYLDHSTGNQKVDMDLAEEVFAASGKLNIPVVAHCEDPETNNVASAANSSDDVSAHSKIRPAKSEAKSIQGAIALSKKYNAPFHIAHLSTRDGIELVRAAKKEGLPVTCEVAPHHLFLTEDDYDRLGTLAKMNPPLRSKEHLDALWAGIEDGTVDCVATDHAPHLLAEKRSGAPLDAPSGVPGVETALPLLLTRLDPDTIKRLMFTNPNKIFHLGKTETDDHITIDLDQEWEIHAKDLHSKCDWTPFEGMKVKGKIV